MLDYVGHFCECPKCGRKILVEQVLFGVSHTAQIGACCGECLAKSGLEPEFVKENPEKAKRANEWLSQFTTNSEESE